MATNLTDMLPGVFLEIYEVPDPVALYALRNSAIEFCRQSTYWRDTLDYYTLPSSLALSAENLPADTRVIKYYDSRIDENQYPLPSRTTGQLDTLQSNWREDYTPLKFEYVTSESQGTIRVAPFPEAASADRGTVITSVTDATPVVVTSAAHGLSNGAVISLHGGDGDHGLFGGLVGASYKIEVVDADTFLLNNTTGYSLNEELTDPSFTGAVDYAGVTPGWWTAAGFGGATDITGGQLVLTAATNTTTYPAPANLLVEGHTYRLTVSSTSFTDTVPATPTLIRWGSTTVWDSVTYSAGGTNAVEFTVPLRSWSTSFSIKSQASETTGSFNSISLVDITAPEYWIEQRTIKVPVALQPTTTATTIDDDVYNDYFEIIIAGALARLYIMPGKSWTSPQNAGAYGAAFAAAVEDAKRRVENAHSDVTRCVSYGGI